MQTDLCALTDQLLPLYTEGDLAPESRQRIDEHAAACATCRERLERAAASLAPPPGAKARMDRPAWQWSARLKRMLLYGLIGMIIGAGGLGYALTRQSPGELTGIPASVKSAGQLAARSIPGWNRAKAAGLVMAIGVTEKIAGTSATVTFEQAWYSGRQVYILYTVKAPKGGHVFAAEAFLEGQGSPLLSGGTDSGHLSQWGGFSSEGFHGVLIFPRFTGVRDGGMLKVNIWRWASVTPEAGLDPHGSIRAEVNLSLPVREAYMNEHMPEGSAWSRQQTWMGRTLTLEYLQVAIGSTALTGRIDLPPGEYSPRLAARLLVAGKALEVKEFDAERIDAGGSYKFTAIFDGVDQWPAPVKLEVNGITFVTDKTLEWPIDWVKYRDMDSNRSRMLAPAEQIPVQFYDSQLIGMIISTGSLAIEQKDPPRTPPYVRAEVAYTGHTLTIGGPSMDLLNDRGDVLSDLRSDVGVIYADVRGHNERQGILVIWADRLTESFQRSDGLLLRYVHPAATMVLKESWALPAAAH